MNHYTPFHSLKVKTGPYQQAGKAGFQILTIKGVKKDIEKRFINEKPKDWPSWKPNKSSTQNAYKTQSKRTTTQKQYSLSDSRTTMTSHSSSKKQKNESKAEKITKKIADIKQQEYKYKIQYVDSQNIPLPDALSRGSARYYKYFHNKENNKFYFYPFQSITNWNYVQLHTFPDQKNQKYKTFWKQMENANQMYPDPIFVVDAEKAMKQLMSLKAKNKYQGKINWKQIDQQRKQIDRFYRSEKI